MYMNDRKPGWDAKAIHHIAKREYGGLHQMFVAHNWPERKDKMMGAVQKHVADRYGTIEAFLEIHSPDPER